MRTAWPIRLGLLVFAGVAARADITLLLEEPYGTFGGMNPTGHAAIYFSRVCADTPVSLRRCRPGELGVVISRYHRVGGYDWLAIPLIPYLYAVDQISDVPTSANQEQVDSIRDIYRRSHLEDIVPDGPGGETPVGDWTQLVGESYDRTMYGFTIQTTEEQDAALIHTLNHRSNQVQFHLLTSNCADFVRQVIDLYFPHAVHRNFTSDVGIMTPKQAAKSLVHYGKKHPELTFSDFEISQVRGTVPRSSRVRGVLESLVRSKRYAVPLASLAVLHPLVGGGLVFAFLDGARFDPRKETSDEPPVSPQGLSTELTSAEPDSAQ